MAGFAFPSGILSPLQTPPTLALFYDIQLFHDIQVYIFSKAPIN